MSQEEDHNDDTALAGEYVLNLLEDDERAAFEARLVAEAALRDRVREWDESLVDLVAGVSPVPPPPMVKDRLQATLFPETIRRKRSLWTWLTGSIAVAIIVGFVVLMPSLLQETAYEPTFTASVAAEDGTLVVAAHFIAETKALELVRETGDARPGRVLELWLIAEGSDAPMSLGVLPDDAETRFTLSPDVAQQLTNGVLAISDEPSGGSPTGAPTGDVLAIGPVTSL